MKYLELRKLIREELQKEGGFENMDLDFGQLVSHSKEAFGSSISHAKPFSKLISKLSLDLQKVNNTIEKYGPRLEALDAVYEIISDLLSDMELNK